MRDKKVRDKKMKQNNSLITTIVYIAIGVLVIGGAYSLGKSNSSSSSNAAASPATLESLVGKPVPQFSLRDRDGIEYSSENLKGKNIVLFFNEGLMCYPACWSEVVALSKNSRLQNNDTVTLSIEPDSASSWQQAIKKMPELGNAKTVFDTDRKVSKSFGALTVASSMHYGSLPGHSYVVIDKDGIVQYVYDDPSMAGNGDLIADEVEKLN